MTILYIDTSSNYLYTGIVKDDVLLTSKKINLAHDLSTFAVDEISRMYKSINLDVIDIDKIIVVSGPGSFTGIRIGMTIAKIYAFCLHKDVTTITSLEAMMASTDDDKIIVPIIDARRQHVYAGVYHHSEELLANQYISLSKLQGYLNNLHQDYAFVSNDRFCDINCIKYDPNILQIVKCFKDKACINPHLVEPTYFKLTEAEENLANE